MNFYLIIYDTMFRSKHFAMPKQGICPGKAPTRAGWQSARRSARLEGRTKRAAMGRRPPKRAEKQKRQSTQTGALPL